MIFKKPFFFMNSSFQLPSRATPHPQTQSTYMSEISPVQLTKPEGQEPRRVKADPTVESPVEETKTTSAGAGREDDGDVAYPQSDPRDSKDSDSEEEEKPDDDDDDDDGPQPLYFPRRAPFVPNSSGSSKPFTVSKPIKR
ncbi:hypothetical protein L218DRAFT_1080088 [Marasmius fiardii PR-910]|nr:hypothetical protein L218DRAFT_1080088 [Marasmius fiardii PR-910]